MTTPYDKAREERVLAALAEDVKDLPDSSAKPVSFSLREAAMPAYGRHELVIRRGNHSNVEQLSDQGLADLYTTVTEAVEGGAGVDTRSEIESLCEAMAEAHWDVNIRARRPELPEWAVAGRQEQYHVKELMLPVALIAQRRLAKQAAK